MSATFNHAGPQVFKHTNSSQLFSIEDSSFTNS